MTRRVDEVAKQILGVVPEQSVLHEQINTFISSLWNQAPESLYSAYNWRKFVAVLNSHGLDDQSLVDQIQLILDNGSAQVVKIE